MTHCNTIFSQILKLIPRHEFETLAKQHHSGRVSLTASRWSQFVTLAMAQLAGRKSLRDIVENVSAQAHRLYHLGSAKLTRSNLSRINEGKPYTLYESLAGKLLGRCQGMTPGHNFRTTKSAVKLHVGLNHDGYLPEFVSITDGKTSDVEMGRALQFPRGSIVAIDRGYNDYSWYNQLTKNKIFFVTRLKINAKFKVISGRSVLKNKGLTSDQVIKFTALKPAKECPIELRRVGYQDKETGKHYVFLTNNFKLSAKTIADIYKARWQVELFFKWIKQNLKIKSFIGTSKNAVMTQIWIAVCIYLLLAFIKFQSKMNRTMQQILRLLQLNLFEKRDLAALLRGDPPIYIQINNSQMTLV